jgi:pyroglutamyl-peptidase
VSRPPPLCIVTGFAPFGGRTNNRSWELVGRLPARAGLEKLQLPVDFEALARLVPALARRKPAVLLMVGEAPVDSVCVEQVALNVADAGIPDNTGAAPRAQPLVASGALALASSWDAQALARSMQRNGIPAVASWHAGTYACNAALYLALHALARRTRAGFLHVPNRNRVRGLTTQALLRGVELGIAALMPDNPQRRRSGA